ncbi:unnamed protein product [Meganyctiphanes norvegica]|uniref:ISXO2-like transposase domain-containing protein n=1 Tax=Meganyctiphanes norvegica TaxID=48144 RepID=A0AAV2R7Q0_MEGNR
MAIRSIKKHAWTSHLQEFMWRERFSDNIFKILCEQIAVQYSNETFINNPGRSYSVEDVNTPNNLLEEKSREKVHILEEPPFMQCQSEVQQAQSNHFISHDSKKQDKYSITQVNNIKQEPSASTSNSSYIGNPEDYCIEEEIYSHIKCLKVSLEENGNILEDSSSNKCLPVVHQGRQHHKKVEEYSDNQEHKPECDSDIVQLFDETTPMLNVIRWFQQHQLLKSEMKCDHCEHDMSWKTDMEMKRYKEGFFWKCEIKSCRKLYCRKNIKVGSVFERSKICLKKWLHIIYKWSKSVGVTAASEQINIDNKTMGQCYSFFREICEQYFKENPVKLGGPGITIEINEFFLSDGGKRNRGAEPQPPIWVLAIADTNCIPSISYMEIVESSDVSTLLPIIIKVVQPGSVIHSKEWRAYRKIQGILDTVKNVDHSVNFVHGNYTMHNQTFESHWKHHESYLMAMRSIKKSAWKSHLQEFMWRERFSGNVFKILCEQISVQYSNDTFNDNQISTHFLEEENKPKIHLGEKLREKAHILEEPLIEECHSIVQIVPHTQSSHTISQDGITQDKVCIKQEYSASNIDNPNHFCFGDEIENHSIKCLEVVQQGNPCHNKIRDYTDNQKPGPLYDSDIVQLFDETTPMLDIIRWFQQHKLLISEMKCDHCQHIMSWKTDYEMKRYKEGFYWKCEIKSCPKFYCRKNIKVGTVFDRSKICLKKWLHIMYKWSKNIGVTAACEQINVDSKTIGQCYSFFREVCEAHFKSNPIKIGGPGITIEINVSFITKWSHKPKGNCEPEQRNPILALGIVDTTCIPAIGYMEIIETDDVATLLPMILKVVQPGSIIRCKEWRAYRKIQSLLNTDSTRNHSVNFEDVDSNEHKQVIESYWEKHKNYISAMRSFTKSTINSYLQELMWRERFSNNALKILCEQISLQYSDGSYIDNVDDSCFGKETEKLRFSMKVKLGESKNPVKNCHPTVPQGGHSIFGDNINQESKASIASYADK